MLQQSLALYKMRLRPISPRLRNSFVFTSPSAKVESTKEWFFAGWARVTGNTVDEDDRKAVYDVSSPSNNFTIAFLSLIKASSVDKKCISLGWTGGQQEKAKALI